VTRLSANPGCGLIRPRDEHFTPVKGVGEVVALARADRELRGYYEWVSRLTEIADLFGTVKVGIE
jgi:hypothetical protein